MRTPSLRSGLRTLGLVLALAAPGCNRTITDLSNADLNIPPDMTEVNYEDFPPQPIFDTSTPPPPANAAALFGPPTDEAPTANGPCVSEPVDGSLVPRNWLRPRVRLIPSPGQNFFEIRVTAPNQKNALVVYTGATTWTMDRDLWGLLSLHTIDKPIKVTVRAIQVSGVSRVGAVETGFNGTFTIAPVRTEGNIVYWTTAVISALKGFTPGLESVTTLYTPEMPSRDIVGGKCLGCHTSTPDGVYVAMSISTSDSDLGIGRVDLLSSNGRGERPPFLTDAARSLLSRTYQQTPQFSTAHWQDGDRTMLSILPVAKRSELVWTDLTATSMATGTGVFAREGDSNQAVLATISHDGQRVLYVSTPDPEAGYSAVNGDIRVIPYNNRQGGASTKLPGASDPAFNEYYPTFSPDDQLVAFDRAPANESSYANPNAEVFVVASGATKAVRLKANDAPACLNRPSPGQTNSWPKWAPEVARSGGRSYYWLTFSSRRSTNRAFQLYMAPVVVEADGSITTYPALNLWNQPPTEFNHTPAWDVFKLILG